MNAVIVTGLPAPTSAKAYRVLLTRDRQGMVIFVPPGNSADPTRSAAFYDSTFGYLADLDIPALG